MNDNHTLDHRNNHTLDQKNEPPYRSVENDQWNAAYKVNKITSYLNILIMSTVVFVDERLRIAISDTLRTLMGPEFDNNFATQIIDRIGSLRSFYLLNTVGPNRNPQDLLEALLSAEYRDAQCPLKRAFIEDNNYRDQWRMLKRHALLSIGMVQFKSSPIVMYLLHTCTLEGQVVLTNDDLPFMMAEEHYAQLRNVLAAVSNVMFGDQQTVAQVYGDVLNDAKARNIFRLDQMLFSNLTSNEHHHLSDEFLEFLEEEALSACGLFTNWWIDLRPTIVKRVAFLNSRLIADAINFCRAMSDLVIPQYETYSRNIPAKVLTEWLEHVLGIGRIKSVNRQNDPMAISRSLTPYLGIVEFDVYCNPTPYAAKAPEPGQEYIRLMNPGLNAVDAATPLLLPTQCYRPVTDFYELTLEQRKKQFPEIYK